MANFIFEDTVDSDLESVNSDNDPWTLGSFELPMQAHYDTPVGDRKVIVILQDAHDVGEKGMTVEILWTSTFMNVFDHFKARSCSTCRVPDEMRFKIASRRRSCRRTIRLRRYAARTCRQVDQY